MERLKQIHEYTINECNKQLNHYGVEGGIAPHTLKKIELILIAPDPDRGALLAKKALDSNFLNCLYQWSQGNASGPKTVEYLEKQARRAEKFAEWMIKKGNNKAAKSQRKRAKELRAEANSLKK